MLIDRAPEVMQFAPDADEHLIEVPFFTWLRTAPFQFFGEYLTETQAPLADALVSDDNAASGQDRLDITQTEGEAVIQLDRVLDHLSRIAETAIRVGACHPE